VPLRREIGGGVRPDGRRPATRKPTAGPVDRSYAQCRASAASYFFPLHFAHRGRLRPPRPGRKKTALWESKGRQSESAGRAVATAPYRQTVGALRRCVAAFGRNTDMRDLHSCGELGRHGSAGLGEISERGKSTCYSLRKLLAKLEHQMAIIGYARVSTQDQHLTGQLEALKAGGAETIYREKISGTRADRPQLAKLMASLKHGDVVLLTKLDRLGRSTRELLDLIEAISKAGASFRSLGEPRGT